MSPLIYHIGARVLFLIRSVARITQFKRTSILHYDEPKMEITTKKKGAKNTKHKKNSSDCNQSKTNNLLIILPLLSHSVGFL